MGTYAKSRSPAFEDRDYSHLYGDAPAFDRIRGKFQQAASSAWASV
jgi:hypothetical protein